MKICSVKSANLVHIADNKGEGSSADKLISLRYVFPWRPILFETGFRGQNFGIGIRIGKLGRLFDRIIWNLLALSDSFCTTGGALNP